MRDDSDIHLMTHGSLCAEIAVPGLVCLVSFSPIRCCTFSLPPFSQDLDEKIAYLKDELQENKAETELISKLTIKESEVCVVSE